MQWLRRVFRKKPVIFIALPVWGEAYLDVFLEATLRAQLAPGNLPALSRAMTCIYHIHTDAAGEAAIRGSALFGHLSSLVRVEFRSIAIDLALDPESRRIASYKTKSDGYRNCLAEAERLNAPCILLNADILMADGFMSYIAKLIAIGKRVLEVPGPRALKDEVVGELKTRFQTANHLIEIKPRDLAALWSKHMHPLMHRHFWNLTLAPEDFHPSHLYWRVSDRDVLCHCFHLYPIMIWPRVKGATFRDTIDDVLVESAAPSMTDADIPDSDDAFCIELSSADHFVGRMARRDDYGSIADAYHRYGSARNLQLLQHPIKIRGGTASEEEWAKIEEDASKVIKEILLTAANRN